RNSLASTEDAVFANAWAKETEAPVTRIPFGHPPSKSRGHRRGKEDTVQVSWHRYEDPDRSIPISYQLTACCGPGSIAEREDELSGAGVDAAVKPLRPARSGPGPPVKRKSPEVPKDPNGNGLGSRGRGGSERGEGEWNRLGI